MKRLRFGLLFALALVSGPAFAGNLFAPFSMDSAGVMPKGVRSVQLGGFSTMLGDKYDGFGASVPLADKFNRSISWKDLLDSQPSGFERGQFRGGLDSLGVSMSDTVGDTRGLVNARLTTTLPLFAWGITEKLTVGVGVPIIYSNVFLGSGWTASPAFQSKLDELSQKGFFNKVLSYEQQLHNVVETKIQGYGYKPLDNETHTDVGDTTVGLKYQVYRDARFAVALSPKVVIPTGRIADVNKVVDIATGDGQWDFGLATTMDYSPLEYLTLTSSVGYTYQMASLKAKRLPQSNEEMLSADLDPSLIEKLGDTMGGSVGARLRLRSLWTLATAYSIQYKAPDSYKGSMYAPERYHFLETDTEQTMQAAQLGLSFSTVPLYLAKKFLMPLEASIGFTSVFGGININKINLTSVGLVSYF